MIDSGTVYHALLPTLIDGSTTSPNMSRGTDYLLLGSSVFLNNLGRSTHRFGCPVEGGDYSQYGFLESTHSGEVRHHFSEFG
jgi:hypothetical protein